MSRPADVGSLRVLRVTLLTILVLAAQQALAGQTRSDGLSESEVTAFVAALQAAVRAEKPAAVADLVVFPLRVNKPPQTMFVKSRGEFVRSYAKIFTPGVRAAILQQNPAELFHNWQGFMIGDGQIWFTGVCPDASCATHRVGVITVNITR
jgi:hypothetical protein